MKSTPFNEEACSGRASLSSERTLKIKDYATGRDAGAESAHTQIVLLNTLKLGDFLFQNRGYSHG